MQNANNLSMGVFLGSALATMNAGDGMLAVSTSAFEGTAIEATRTWFAETGRKIWVVGPLEDAPAAATANIPGGEVLQHVAEDAKILGFLDEMEQKHGARSVIFVRCRHALASHPLTRSCSDRLWDRPLPEGPYKTAHVHRRAHCVPYAIPVVARITVRAGPKRHKYEDRSV
jgi:hypothetical protein